MIYLLIQWLSMILEKRFRWTILIFLGFNTGVFGQSYLTLNQVGKKEQAAFQEAKSLAANGQYEKALKTIHQLQSKFPTFIESWLLLGKIKYDLNALPEAQAAFLKVIGFDPDFNTETYYMLGVTEWKLDQFDQAAQHLEVFLQKKPRSERLKSQAQRYFENAQFASYSIKNPVPFTPKPLDEAINSEMPEYLPSLTADQQMLVFTRYVQGQEDFYSSKKVGEQWQKAVAMEDLNTPLNEGAQTIAADGKTIVFGAGDREGGFGGYDLYISESRNDAFTAPINLGEAINTKARERQPSLSSDGKTLFFECNRPDGLGGTDIWVAYKQANGSWTKAQHIGQPINTGYDESAPFLHPDGQTLYFMSNGHPGMGGFDLYLSRKQPDGTWGKPINLGYPINTKADEGALIVSLDGQKAYFTSDKTKGRATDIFEFEMPKSIQPQAVTYVKATVKDADTKKVLPNANAVFINPTNNTKHLEAKTDQEGTFLVVLPKDTDFGLNVSCKGYVFYSEYFALSESYLSQRPYNLEIFLQAIPKATTSTPVTSKPIVLKNLFFETGSSAILEKSFPELQQLKTLLEQQPQLHIEIQGHTDDVGDELSNQQLSEQRAQAVYDYLVKVGISQARLAYKGFGESQPIAPNDTPEGRQINRRTAFIIKGK